MRKIRSTYILGLTYFGWHDSCAVLLKDGKVVAAAEEERFTRKKFDRSFPKNAINWCLNSANISIKEVNYAGYFWQPWVGISNRILYSLRGLPTSLGKGSRNANILLDLIRAKHVFLKETGFCGKFYFLNHHLTHAASTFFASGYKSAAILSVDGTGEKTTCWAGRGNGIDINCYKATNWPHSLGHLYATATQYLGFQIFSDEYKVMGLAPYGKPEYLEDFRKIIKIKNDGTFEIDLSYIDYPFGKRLMYSDKWIKRFGKPRNENSSIEKRHKDIAASIQKRTEEVLEAIIINLMNEDQSGSLCITGGVGLNSVAIGKIAEKGICERIYETPVSSDAGCALGAAYYIYHIILRNKDKHPLLHPYLGSKFDEKKIKQALKKYNLKYKQINNTEKKAAELIARGHVIGWFQGNSEIGQRALGNRSILADPRNPKMKDKVNRLIKYREPFRPFAPSILEKYQSEYFEWNKPVPFMTEVHPVKKEKRKIIPAVTHIDGSGRLQTVLKKTNPKFWKLINEFFKITGVPVVLNTSFNVKGEPIVDSPDDAITTFLKSGIDDLFLENFWVIKS